MDSVRRWLTRLEIDSLLRREPGAKGKVAEEAGKPRTHVSRWLHDLTWNCARIEQAAQRQAWRIADLWGLPDEDIYIDPARKRMSPASDCGETGECVA